MKQSRTSQFFAMLVIAILVVTACSTQKNTPQSRWWHSFNAKYNTYFNGAQAYIDASLEKEKQNVDNFTEIIPLYTVGNKKSREIGKGNYDRAIEKSEKAIKQHSIKRRPEWNKRRRKTERDIEWLNRKEYNPFLWKAWMLMGRSQFHKGAFDEAAATFSYMSRLYQTQPAIYGRARAWLAKSYIEQDWIYDAEDVIRNMMRDSIDWRARKEWDYTLADYYIHTGDYAAAIPYLRKVIRHEMRRVQKAREWYLLGQLYSAIGQKDNAYKAFRSVVRQNPPYELEFNARIAMTEVLSDRNAKQMVIRLKRMARNDKNKDYLDQVYYAIGNIHLAQRDTMAAIAAYEKGNEKATRSGVEKGVLLLRLGDLYWDKEKYNDAQRCYGQAIGLLDKDRNDYAQLADRSKKLDELVPYTDAIHLQDSLQELARMPEDERNKAIDRVIEALKKKEKEERRAQQEAEAAQQMQQNAGVGNRNALNTGNRDQQQTPGGGVWYFYNQMAVVQGKSAFEKQWGKRENADDWQRINKTVVGALNSEGEDIPQEVLDSIAAVQAMQDSLDNVVDSAKNDPHKREYYLEQIPFTEEQILASNLIIQDGLFNSGVIFKDKFDNLPLSKKQFDRLTTDFPDFEKMDEVYYHLFLLYSRMAMHGTANDYVELLKAKYPDSKLTGVLTDPYFKENAQLGTHLEDSLYAATYEAFLADRYDEVDANAYVSETRFPLGANRDKFIFISGLNGLNRGNIDKCVENMEQVVKNYPQSRISEMAGMIVNGVREGRRLYGGKFDLSEVWDRRNVVLRDSDSTAVSTFQPDRNINHNFLIVYNPDSISENQLLFEIARFNFTNYLVRNFDITIEELEGLRRMKITGFRSFDEAHLYAQQVYANKAIANRLSKARGIIISDKNLPLLGTTFSYKDYDVYYAKHFAPLIVTNPYLLTEPTEIKATYAEDIIEKKESDEENEEGTQDEGYDFNQSQIEEYNLNEEQESETPMGESPLDEPLPVSEEPLPVVDDPQQPSEGEPLPTIDEPLPVVDDPRQPSEDESLPTIDESVPVKEKQLTDEEVPIEPLTNEQLPVTTPEDNEEEGFIIDDFETTDDDEDSFIFDETDENSTNDDDDQIVIIEEKNKKQDDDDFDVDDEYYELDGF